MRNANGYGSVYKLSGKRRRPYVAVKTVSLKGGIQKRVILGYYVGSKEAKIALAEYNRNPYDLTAAKITFYEIFKKLLDSKKDRLQKVTLENKEHLFKYFEPLYKVPIKEIKLAMLQELFDLDNSSYGTIKGRKSLCMQIFDFALKRELVEKNYGTLIDINKKNEKVIKRKIFTSDEIAKLWELSGIQEVDMILIMIYTGLRIGELLNLKIEDINLEERYCRTGSKTEAGKNRLIPFNYKILPLIIKNVSPDKTYLFQSIYNKKISYSNWRKINFSSLMEKLGFSHTIHDCRHTFATLLNNADANPTSIKSIIGHSNFETTEKIYTHKDIEELKKAVDKII